MSGSECIEWNMDLINAKTRTGIIKRTQHSLDSGVSFTRSGNSLLVWNKLKATTEACQSIYRNGNEKKFRTSIQLWSIRAYRLKVRENQFQEIRICI